MPSIDLKVTESLHGQFDVGEVVTIRVGAQRSWHPFPLVSTIDGEEVTSRLEEEEYQEVERVIREGYLEVGSQLGAGLYHIEEPMEAWSPIMEPFFIFGDDGFERQGRSYSCGGPPPWEGTSLKEFIEGVQSCPDSEGADDLYARTVGRAMDEPSLYIAGGCYIPGMSTDPYDELEEGECFIYSDCVVGEEICSHDGLCVEGDCNVDANCGAEYICVDHQCVRGD